MARRTVFTKAAGHQLFTLSEVERFEIVALIDDCARTGLGPVVSFHGSPCRHVRYRDHRATLEEDGSRVLVIGISPIREA